MASMTSVKYTRSAAARVMVLVTTEKWRWNSRNSIKRAQQRKHKMAIQLRYSPETSTRALIWST